MPHRPNLPADGRRGTDRDPAISAAARDEPVKSLRGRGVRRLLEAISPFIVPYADPDPEPPADGAPGDRTRNDLLGEIAVLNCRSATMPAIEQAKGALMAIYGLTNQAAFELLRWHSQHRNIKLRDLAARLTAALPDSGIGTSATTGMDRLLDTITEDQQPAGQAS